MILRLWFRGTGFKQKWLAGRVDVTPSAMSLYTNQQRIPNPPTQARIEQETRRFGKPFGKDYVVEAGERDWCNGKESK